MTDYRDVMEVLRAAGHPALVSAREAALICRSYGHLRNVPTGAAAGRAVALVDVATDLARFLDQAGK